MAVSLSPAAQAQHYELTDPDVRLMLRVRDGDAAAFEQLVLRYQSRLIMVLEHLVGRQSAEDLAQDVFLRVYRARETYQPGAKFSTWLFRIAHNVASNARRSLSRRKEVNISLQQSDKSGAQSLDQLAKAASGLMPTRQLDRAEMAQVVQQAMQALNERQRMALLLSKFEGMSYEEVGEAMGLSLQAVKSLLSRARANLRDILEPYMQTGQHPHGDDNGQSS